jgi:hypothetical protein
MAPAPSPKRMHEFLSSQSTHLVSASCPTTSAFFADPPGSARRNCPAVTIPKRNPEHAAVRSNAAHLFESHPIACAVDYSIRFQRIGEKEKRGLPRCVRREREREV